MYDRILVPSDGSPGSEAVANQAATLASETGATLYAISVIDESAYDVDVEASPDVREARRDAGDRALDAVADIADERGVDVHTELRRGVPESTIVDYSVEVDADLIVMGTHGRRGLERYLLGSVTEHVLRASDRPVLAVKLDAATVPDEEEAEHVAREAISAEGVDDAALREEPYRQQSTWIVPFRSADGRRMNVHVDGVSGETRIAQLDR